MKQVHEVNGHFAISEDEVWRPGAYATHALAEAALELPDEVLRYAQDDANAMSEDDPAYGVIDADFLRQAVREWNTPIKASILLAGLERL